MKTKLSHQLKTAVAAICLITPMSSMAVTWGTGAESYTSTCASFSATCSTGTSPSSFSPTVDNVSGATSSSSISDVRGASEAHATIINSSGIEMVHLAGQAGAGQIAQASAWGLNTYTYSGANTSITLDIDLTGSLSNAGSAFTKISADIYIIDPNDIDSFPTTDLRGNFGEGIPPIAHTELEIIANTAGVVSITDSLNLSLANGDEFSIWALLYVGAGDNGQVQAMNSLDLSFSNNAGLTSVASVSAVPVPAAVWLFGSGLLGLVGVARRKA